MTSGDGVGHQTDPGLVREHHVTLRRQLAAGLEAAIRDGHLGPGSQLPSTRDMARRLGLHRSTVTAAYARLRRRGCVVGGVGKRLRVARPGDGLRASSWPDASPGAGSPPRGGAESLVEWGIETVLGQAARRGVSREVALSSLAEKATKVAENARAGRHPVTLFEPCPGLRAALAMELEVRLCVPVEVSGTLGGARDGVGPLLVRADLLGWVTRRRLGLDIIPLNIAGGTRERGLVRRIARGGLVTLVSVSQTIRRYARDLAAREFGRGVSFRAMPPSDTRAVYRSVGASRLVLYDEPSRRVIPHMRAVSSVIRLLTETQVGALRAYLSAPPAKIASAPGHTGSRITEPRRGT